MTGTCFLKTKYKVLNVQLIIRLYLYSSGLELVRRSKKSALLCLYFYCNEGSESDMCTGSG